MTQPQHHQPGNELAELLWDNGPALLRRTQLPATPFPPFACSAAKRRHHPAMRDLLAAPDDDDAVPWLQHYPGIGMEDDDDDREDTAPLPPEYCSALLSGYAGLPDAVAGRDDAGASTSSHGAAPTVPPKQQQPRPSGEGIMNFTFFSRPLQRPQPPPSAAPTSIPVGGVDSTVVQTSRLRSTPLFSEQRMAWLQPPPKEPRAAVAASPSAPPPPAAAPPVPLWQREFAAAVAALPQPQRLQSETRAPDRPPPPPMPPATATTSSVCSDNGDRSQLKRSSGSQQAPEWSVSQEDEDLDVDDEAGPSGARRSAARSTKRGRTAEVHNMSERRRRDRINEKMRALQELIPNCNKIDKASMLEEAIEYLKTLQLQVQMMSTMGCVPPMLAMHMPPMAAHFHHRHLHLGAMGFGMGSFDPRLVAAAAAQFPYPMIPGMPMFGHGHHAMPPPPAFPQHPAAIHMAAGNVVDNDAAAAAAAQAEQETPGDHPHVPRAM